MMDSQFNREFRYLDGTAERHELIKDIHRVRQSVISLAEAVPPDKQFEPRYHGWSLAALLAHLNTIDNVTLLAIKLSLIGFHPPLPLSALNQFNDLTARLFQRRLVETTIRGMNRNEKRIADFIMTLPMERFTRQVYHSPSGAYLTVEQGLQQFFLFHWQEHLQTMQRVEGIFYEPPGTTAEI